MLTYTLVNANVCLNALGDPTRRAILELVAQGPQSVGELSSGMPVSRPAVSPHLRVLSDAGLVLGLPRATAVSTGSTRVGGGAPGLLDRFWPRALAAFRAEVERPTTTKENP
ncbi:MAG: metalloregulator ArsR/SmtB family transcription factor [Actinomycetota bacterium]|nr:metalloregulator ArsR/SmtB family transcription factor [Actinomycetota bacterium]